MPSRSLLILLILLLSWLLAAPAGAGSPAVEWIGCESSLEFGDAIPYERMKWRWAADAEPPPGMPKVEVLKSPPATKWRVNFGHRLDKKDNLLACSTGLSLFRLEQDRKHLDLFFAEGVQPRLIKERRLIVIYDPREVGAVFDRALSEASTRQSEQDPARKLEAWKKVRELLAEARSLDIHLVQMRELEATAYLETNRNQGRVYFEQGAYREAIPYLEEALRLSPRDFEISFLIAQALHRTDQLDAAHERLQELLKSGHGNAEVVHFLGRNFLRQQDYPRAVAELTHAVDLGHESSHLFLGFAQFQLNRYDEALTTLEKSIATETDPAYRERAQRLLESTRKKLAPPSRPSPTRVEMNDGHVGRAAYDEPAEHEEPTEHDEPAEHAHPSLEPEHITVELENFPAEETEPALRSRARDWAYVGDSTLHSEGNKLLGRPAYKHPTRLQGFGRPAQKLRDFRGDVVALHFWATWCGPCKPELEIMTAFHREAYPELNERGLEVVTVSVDSTKEDLERYLALEFPELPDDFKIYWDPNWETLIETLGAQANALPQTFLIDRRGNIRHARIGAERWLDDGFVQDLEALLDE